MERMFLIHAKKCFLHKILLMPIFKGIAVRFPYFLCFLALYSFELLHKEIIFYRKKDNVLTNGKLDIKILSVIIK